MSKASYVGSRTMAALVSNPSTRSPPPNWRSATRARAGIRTPESAVAESFQDLLPGTTINGPTVARSQLLKPFPEFTGVTITIPTGAHLVQLAAGLGAEKILARSDIRGELHAV